MVDALQTRDAGGRAALARPVDVAARLRDVLQEGSLRATIILCGLLSVGIWAAALFYVSVDRERTWSEAERDTSNLARIIAEQTQRTIAGTDLVLRSLVYTVRQSRLDRDQMDDLLHDTAADSDVIVQLSYANQDGEMVSSSVERNLKPLQIGDREHFAVHKGAVDVGLYISKPVLGRASKRWSIQLTRRIPGADGGLAGVFVASIDPFYFGRTFDDLDVGKGGVITIFGADGILRARSVMDDRIIGADLSRSDLFKAAISRQIGVVLGTSVIDGKTRLTSFRAIPGYPLYVSAGYDETEFAREFVGRRRLVLAGAAGFTIVLLITCLFAVRSALQHRRANAAVLASAAVIARVNDDLEQRVGQRTAELSESLESLRKAQDQAIRAEKMASLGTLAGGIAHEINTPIQFISDNLTFLGRTLNELAPLFEAGRIGIAGGEIDAELRARLKDADLDFLAEESAQAIAQSQDGVARIGEIVNAIKIFAHPRGDEMAAQQPAQLLSSVATISKSAWKYVAELELDIAPDLPPVACQSTEITQVLLNLVINAAHAIQERGDTSLGKITLGAKRVGDMVEFSVADTGVGIPDAIRNRVWDLFFTTKEVGKGTGQGLAIAQRIVCEHHHGEIDFESTPGRGSRFHFTLHTAAASEPAAADTVAAQRVA